MKHAKEENNLLWSEQNNVNLLIAGTEDDFLLLHVSFIAPKFISDHCTEVCFVLWHCSTIHHFFYSPTSGIKGKVFEDICFVQEKPPYNVYDKRKFSWIAVQQKMKLKVGQRTGKSNFHQTNNKGSLNKNAKTFWLSFSKFTRCKTKKRPWMNTGILLFP
jgi:hypothetical protein